MAYIYNMKILPISVNNAENKFERLANAALRTPPIPVDRFALREKRCETLYKSLNREETLCEKLSDLVVKLLKVGNLDIAGVICSKLAKFQHLPFELREKYLRQGQEVAELQDDKMHLVARLEDLHREYVKQGATEKLRKVLVREERTLKDIISDFTGSVEKFRTVGNKDDKEIEKYQDFLATTQVDLAKILYRSDPKKAIKKLKNAISIFRMLGDDEKVKFAQLLLKMAKENLYGEDYFKF